MHNLEREVSDRIADVYARSKWSRFSENMKKSLADLADHETLDFRGRYPGSRFRKFLTIVGARFSRSLLDKQIQFNMATRQALEQTHVAVTGLEHALRVLGHKHVELLPVAGGRPHAGHAKPRVAYFSPLRPVESGIADYSENLLPYLRDYFEMDLFHDDVYRPEADVAGGVFAGRTYPADQFESCAAQNDYAAVIYHLGNNPFHIHIYVNLLRYAGITVLHDYHLGGLLHNINARSQEIGLTRLQENTHHYGEARADEIDWLLATSQLKGPDLVEQQIHMNRRVFTRSLGVVVHSRWAYEEAVRDFSGDCDNIAHIPLLSYPVQRDPAAGREIRDRLGVAEDCFLVCAFGYVAPAKRPFSILEAFQQYLRHNPSAHLVFAGTTEDKLRQPLQDALRDLGIEGRVHFTGFLDMADFCRYIQATDICVNLRYPFYGETSATLVQHLSFGKPVIVTDIGSFSEFPDDVVFKIPQPGDCDEAAETYKALVALTEDPARREAMGRAALEYVSTVHSPERCADLYAQFVAQVLSSPTAKRKMLADYVGREASVHAVQDPDALFGQLSQVISHCDADSAKTLIQERMGTLP